MADVKKINGMNINDDISRTNIGCTQDTYSNQKTYSVGDIVVCNNTIYKCITAVTAKEEFTAAKWKQICLRDLLIETREKNILMARLSANNQTMVNAEETLYFDTHNKIGSKLSFSNHGVKIGAGVSQILVSGAVSFTWGSPASNNAILVIKKNTSELFRVNGSKPNATQSVSTVCPPYLATVQEGDVITAYIYGKVDAVIQMQRTYLTVEVVK